MKLGNEEKIGCLTVAVFILIIVIWALVSGYNKPPLTPSEEEYYQDNQGCVETGRGCL